MTRYLVTFVSGFEKVVERFLKEDFPTIHVIDFGDGCGVFETDEDISSVVETPYVNNVFLILKSGRDFSVLIDQIGSDKRPFNKIFPLNFRCFKVFTSVDGNLVPLERRLMTRVIDILKQKTRCSYDVVRADGEFWFMKRRSSDSYFLFRLTKRKKKTAAGELRPEISTVLCRLSDPQESDVFCDPFCGSGSIALTRSRMKSYKGIFASDIERHLIEELKKKTKPIKSATFRRSFFMKCRDFFESGFEDHFFDVIVTDPPWGVFKTVSSDFYMNFFIEAARILKPSGRLVVLTAQKDQIKHAERFFHLKERYDILLSGQKAGVFVFDRF